jgi:hypothetical protein
MEEEGQLLAGLGQFRATGEVSVPLAEVLFGIFENSARPTDIFGRLTTVSFDGPRLRGLLVRVSAYVGLLAIFAFLIWEAYSSGADERLVLCICGAVAIGVLAAVFVYHECRLLLSALAPSGSRPEESAGPPGFRVLGADETPLSDDPAVRKYTRELEKAGFTRMGDLTRPDDGPIAWVYRVFYAPDGVTHLTLLCSLALPDAPGESPRLWPASVEFHAETFYANRGRAESVTEEAYGYLGRPVGADCLFRVLPELRDPMELYRSHGEAAEVFALERGLTPKRHGLFEDYLRRQEAMETETRQRSRDQPRSWRDGLRWYLQWPRREQRG